MMFWDWNVASGLWVSLWIVFVLAVLVTPWVFFLMALRGVLEKVSPQNRAMAPEHVWLNLIPVFNLGWFIYTVAKVRDSVKAEYYSRGWPLEGDFGYNVGLAAGIVGICAVVLGWVPVIDFALGIAAFVCWLVYLAEDGRSQEPAVDGRPVARHRFAAALCKLSVAVRPANQVRVRHRLCSVLSTCPTAGAAAGADTSNRPIRRAERRAQPASQPGSPAPKRTQPTQCAVCGTTVAPDDRFCRGCGLPLP